MLQIKQLTKSYGTRTLFDDVTFALTPGERLGLVGRNGSGKTTLLKLILGEEAADSGRIDRPKQYSVGHLSQHLDFEKDSVLEEACLGLPEQEGGWREEYLAEQALMGLGFTIADFDRPPSEFSGGYQVRLQLAKVLVSQPDLLLLDEPTNYLDIVSMRWLQRYLRGWQGEVILITHDRDFMDRVTTHTAAIWRGKCRRIEGPSTKLYEMLAAEEEIHEKTRVNQLKSRRDAERFVERFRAQATKARQVQSRIKQLEKQGTIEQLADVATLDFKFNPAPFHAPSLIRVDEIEFGYDSGPTLIEGLSLDIAMGDRVAIIGKNGKGKSTLLNLLGGELRPRSGTMKPHPSIELAHFGQTNIDRLHEGLTIEEEIMSVVPDHNQRTARGICGLMMFSGEDALKKVDVLSGGERARVLLGKLLVSPANLVLLDEPTNHLDMESIDSLIDAVQNFPGGALIVTHNERVLHALATKLIVFDRDRVTVFDNTYREFLDRVGWSDENDGKPKKPKVDKSLEASAGSKQSTPSASGKGKGKAKGSAPRGKAGRAQRAKIVEARSKALRPLLQKIKKLEDAITAAETQLEATNKSLEQASVSGDKNAIIEHSTKAAELQKSIDTQFAALEEVTIQHDDQARGYDEQLEGLGG